MTFLNTTLDALANSARSEPWHDEHGTRESSNPGPFQTCCIAIEVISVFLTLIILALNISTGRWIPWVSALPLLISVGTLIALLMSKRRIIKNTPWELYRWVNWHEGALLVISFIQASHVLQAISLPQ